MTIVNVTFSDGREQEFFSIAKAKAAMKGDANAKGFITKVRSNGDWIPCGYIQLKGRNDSIIAGATRQTVASY